MAKKVTEIPATRNRFTSVSAAIPMKRKVAGYARVSTELEEQQSSYANQVDYYTNYIKSRADWEFAGIYTDEGISATNTKRREGFKRMVDDALSGKIDLIITKSISRFARNTVDSLTTVRKLKENGTEIYFEKENIWTMDSKGELLITIMSSLAQEESRSISENVVWGKRKGFAQGKASVAYTHFLGYDKDFSINEREARTVRLIYKLFLSGLSCTSIAKEMERREEKAPYGGERWHSGTVKSILTNEKYRGDALLQKEYISDFLQKTRKKNEGEIPQYYVEEHHPAIIDPATFELVQAEMERRKKDGVRFSGISIFASKIRCGECGGWYGRRTWHSTDKYRCTVYQCIKKYTEKRHCKTPHIKEEDIKRLFVEALNRLVFAKEETLANLENLRETVCDVSALDWEREEKANEAATLEKKIRSLIAANARAPQDQGEYGKKYDRLKSSFEKALERMDAIDEEKKKRHGREVRIRDFIGRLSNIDGEQTTFDESLWSGMVEYVTVHSPTKIVFTFVGGIEVTVG